MTSDNSNHVTVNVNTPNSRGSGTVLLLVFFWWVLVWWWALLLGAWVTWMLVAGVAAIFDHGELWFKSWYQPLPLWLFGIR